MNSLERDQLISACKHVIMNEILNNKEIHAVLDALITYTLKSKRAKK